MNINSVVLTVLGLSGIGYPTLAQEPVVVTATVTNEKELTSQLQLGVSHTKPGLLYDLSKEEKLDPAAVVRAKALISEASSYQNTHIMGWELGNPNPTPEEYDWGGIDARMEFLGPDDMPVITLCAAPDWMKVADFPLDDPDRYYPDNNHTNWDLIEKAPLPEHYGDFAHLAAEVARRYPQVKYYQVWNELKGFWSEVLNNWDYVAYTKFYNVVYDSLKAVNPNIQVGGGYLVIQGTGSVLLGKEGQDTHVPISDKDQKVLAYWLREKHGADFICVDRGVIDFHDPNKEAYTWEEKISLMYLWEKVGKEVQELVNASETPDLPLWWSEYYGDTGGGGQPDLAAAYATLYYYMIRGGASTALLWNPMEGEVPHYLFTKAIAGGAQPVPHYTVFKDIHDHFGEGVDILKTTTSDPAVSVLASPKKTMLINAKQEAIILELNGSPYSLEALEVRLINTLLPTADVVVTPMADATVRDGAYRDKNYGQETYLSVKDVHADYNRRSFLRFAIAELDRKASTELLLSVTSLGRENVAERRVALHALADNSWPEEQISWNSQPQAGELLTSFTISAQDVGKSIRVDVTDYVAGSGGATVGFALVQPAGQNAIVSFGSRESDTPPLLRSTVEETRRGAPVLASTSITRLMAVITTYPNPVRDVLHVRVTPPLAGDASKRGRATEVRVVNPLGEPVLRQPLDASGEVDVSALPSGIYLVYIIQGGNVQKLTKIVKQ